MRFPFLVALLVLLGCSSPQVDRQWWDTQKGSFVADWPVPSLGIYADAEDRVVVLLPGSTADQVGIQVNDILLELHLTGAQNANVKDSVPFHDDKAIWDLIRSAMALQRESTWYSIRESYKPLSGPFIVTVQRGSQTLEFEVLLEGQAPWPVDAPTPTPIPRSLRYF